MIHMIRGGPISVGPDDILVVDAIHLDGTCSVHLELDMKFEIYDREDDKVGVRLEGGNGEIMFGTQGYASEGNARRAIKRLKQGVKDAPVVRIKKKEKTDGAA